MRRFIRTHLSMASLGGTTISQTVIVLSGAGSGITLARTLGPNGRGELAIALLWPGILTLLGDLGLGFAFSYHAGKLKDKINALWTLALLTGLLIGVGMALFGWLVVPLFVPALRGAARASFGAALFSVPMVLTGGFQAYLLLGDGAIADYTAIRLIAALAYLIDVLGFSSLGWTSVYDFVIAFVLAQACGLALSTCLVVKRFRPRFQITTDLIPRLFSYGLQTQLASMASQANLKADQALMSIMIPAQQLGQYVVAVAVSGVLSPFLSALAVVILPRTTHALNNLEGATLATRYVKLASLLSLPVLLVSISIMPWLLPAFFGRQYAPAVLSAQVLVVASLMQGINMVLGNSLRGLGRPSAPAVAEGLGLAVTFSLLYLLLPVLGILGAAVASLAAYAAIAVLQFFFIANAAGLRAADLVLTPLDNPFGTRPMQLLRQLVK